MQPKVRSQRQWIRGNLLYSSVFHVGTIFEFTMNACFSWSPCILIRASQDHLSIEINMSIYATGYRCILSLLCIIVSLCQGLLPDSFLHHDYCIIGAGPAGLQMAYFLHHSQRDYLVLERNNISGSFFLHYPRHRKLISINKRYTGKVNREFNLRHDWNSLLSHDERLLYRHYSRDFFPHADTMVHYLNNYSRILDLKVQYNTDVTHVQLEKDPQAWNGHYFFLTDQREKYYRCSVLIVATGIWIPNTVNFPGSEYVEGYESVSIDPYDFAGQTVLILGRGNAAFETAYNIMGSTNFIHMVSRSRVRLSWSTHYVGDVRAVNDGLLDNYQLKSLDGLFEGEIEDMAVVRDKAGKLHLTFQQFLQKHNISLNGTDDIPFPQDDTDNFAVREPYDRIIRCLGWKFDFSIFGNGTRPLSAKGLRNKYPQIKMNYESVTTPGMFVIGTASHSIDFRKSTGGFIHGFRYSTRAVHRLLEYRYHGIHWPSVVFPVSQLTAAVVRRINEASGPYQMFGVLADVVLLRRNSTEFEYLEEYPVGILPDLKKYTGREVDNGLFVITMEYGKNFSGPGKDVFHYNRSVGEPWHAWLSNFLHPVVYYYKELPTEQDMKYRPKNWPLPRPDAIHHVVEDFLIDWSTLNSHILPLRRFLENCLETDLRNFFAETCFQFALSRLKLPPYCQQRYLKKQGLMGNEVLTQHAVEAGLMENYSTKDLTKDKASSTSQHLLKDSGIHIEGSLFNDRTTSKDEL
ncbi:FAD-dependent oxidoreductase domain-containing protein 2 [Protopterus annectens]|uniref:FAD-dependent oxidoreductase domain-containing protein 2 n=1 Tax=Protopterus annectens TaxID=7888 RepID=UPI001CF97384|nr:FAD-dependent oxidoreductase domain-containing protein 2 [Protopterus annectens]